ncbi:MAG: replication and repair protein RecF [Candidatus Saccharibacteria bacterium]|nr:replication and repair protein RecF [Candidatus Saccharibacteria bacterium]
MITSIRLQNFRSYRDDSFEFEPGVNIIVGPNASGKTNLMEAVLVLCEGSSYRARDPELIKFKKPWTRLDGYFDKSTRSLKIEYREGSLEKTYLFDEKTYKRVGLDKTVPVVYFEPNHLQLITRGPDARRDYMDDLLARSRPQFKPLANNYKRTLAQRNALLKRGPGYGQQQLFAWDIRLSELGELIARARQELTDDINKNLSATYSQIAHSKTKVSLEYKSQFPADNYGSRMLSKLEATAQADFERGFTGHGPHREDFAVDIAAQPANITASRGENRSLMLALKVYELDLIERSRGISPIFLLDDVFSELDGARRKALVEFLKDRQTIITTTDADTVVDYFATGNHRIIPLQKD